MSPDATTSSRFGKPRPPRTHRDPPDWLTDRPRHPRAKAKGTRTLRPLRAADRRRSCRGSSDPPRTSHLPGHGGKESYGLGWIEGHQAGSSLPERVKPVGGATVGKVCAGTPTRGAPPLCSGLDAGARFGWRAEHDVSPLCVQSDDGGMSGLSSPARPMYRHETRSACAAVT